MKKRLFAILSAMLLLGACMLPVYAAEEITDKSEAWGSSYTDSAVLAAVLDEVFAGDVDLYSNGYCTKEQSVPLGSSLMTGGRQYWVMSDLTGESISGWQCYIYANAVYSKLFGEWIRHGDEEYLYSETVIGGGAKTVSYELFAEADVRCGAYMRTTGNSDGSYNSSSAHSLIILAYDQFTVTYLDGNSDGRGLVRINTRTWEDFNRTMLSGRGRRVNHVIQPAAAYYEMLYPAKQGSSELKTGDVSGDGVINARDYLMLKRSMLGTYRLSQPQRSSADVDGNGKLTARDYLMVKRHVLGTYRIEQ